MAKKVKRARKRATKRLAALGSKQAQRVMAKSKFPKAQIMRAKFIAECAAPPPAPPLYTGWDVDCAKARAAEAARAADAFAVLTSLLKQVPEGGDGMITC